MKAFRDKVLGYAVAGVFIFGLYAIAHYLLKADDQTIMLFAMWMLWTSLASYINSPDSETSK